MRAILLTAVLTTVVLLSGCAGGTVRPSGKILRNGQPVQLSDKGVIVLNFLPESGDKLGVTYAADTKPDGTFTITGPERKGIPPGKYKVAVELYDPYPTTDLLKGKYAPGATTLTAEVGSGEVVVDVK